MRKTVLIFFAALFIVIFSHLPAFAFLGDTIGVGIRAMTMGEAFVAVADDYSATYYNPAGLGQSKDVFNLTIDWIQPFHTFDVKSLATGQDLTGRDLQGHEDWNPTESADDSDMDDLDHNRPTIGISTNLTKLCSALNIPFNLTLGAVVMIPNNFSQAMTLSDFTPDIPKFTRFGDVDEQIVIAFSLGAEAIKDKLYLGLGAQIKIAGDGDIHNEGGTVDLQGEFDLLAFPLQIDWRVWGEVTPILGVLYIPFDDKKLKIGAAYREENTFEIGPTQLTMGYLSSSAVQNMNNYWQAIFHFLFAYSPTAYSAGVSYAFDTFTLSAELEYQQWSDFFYVVTSDYHYAVNEPLLSGYVPDGPEFDDITNVCLGMEYRYTDALTFTSGYQYMPTPVPDQSNRVTNYLDMDKHVFSVGASYSLKHLKPPKGFKSLPIKIGAMFQYMMCEDYKVYKTGEIHGWAYRDQESYEVEGDVFIAGISIEIDF